MSLHTNTIDRVETAIPRKYMGSKQAGRFYTLRGRCTHALEDGEPVVHVVVDNDETPMVISLVTDFLDKNGYTATLTTKLVTEYDAYHCHDYQCAKTYLVIVPRPAQTDRFLPNTEAHAVLMNTRKQLDHDLMSKL